MSKWTANDVPDQSGKTAIITGANTGLGFQVAQVLARHGASVVVASRDPEKAERAATRIGDGASWVRLDLASLASVREAAAELRSRHSRIDLLICNAGVLMTSPARSADGFELHFAVDYLGHFALTGLLLPTMTAVPGSRVVSVISSTYAQGQYPPRQDPKDAYPDAKLANLVFTLELQRRLAAAHADTIALAADPGYAKTEMLRHQSAMMQLGSELAVRLMGQDAAGGALPILRAATDRTAQGGQLYGPRWQTKGHPVLATPRPKALDTATAQRLWADSENDTHVTYDLKQDTAQQDTAQ